MPNSNDANGFRSSYAIPKGPQVPFGQESQAAQSGSGVLSTNVGHACAGQAVENWFTVMDQPHWGDVGKPHGSQIAEALARLQDQRNRELLDKAKREALAASLVEHAEVGAQPKDFLPGGVIMTQRFEFDAVAFEALQRTVEWLKANERTHAQQIAMLQGTIRALAASVATLESKLANAYVPQGGGMTAVQYRVNSSCATTDHIALCKQAMAKAMDRQQGAHEGCEHDMLKSNTTVSAITRKKARCNVCAQVWESV